jgi:methylmalonyl-CoA/ethylmalonyl-CoA epimerase
MTADTKFGLSEIGQIALTVKDVEKATEYYRDVLGMQLLFEVPGMAFFRCGSIRLLLGSAELSEFEHPPTILYYRVEDIGAACETLRGRGAELERGPELTHKAEDHELWLAFLRDPDGHVLALMSEVPTG